MESKKGRPEPPWLVILEDIRSQNLATLQAVQASRVALEKRFDLLDQRTESRIAVFQAALQPID